MSGEIYNPNPTVFVAEKSNRKTTAEQSLWLDDDDDFSSGLESSEDESAEPESIDQDEIFGTLDTFISFVKAC